MSSRPFVIKADRLETLTDGVFAIAMTLLVLGIAMPTLSTPHRTDALTKALLDMWPDFFHYVLSFLILGRVWVALTYQFELIHFTDRTHLYLNLFILMMVGLIPFSTSLIANYPGIYVAELVFHTNFLLMSGAMYAQLRYAIRHDRLSKDEVDKRLARQLELINLAMPILALTGIALTFVTPRWSTAPYFILILLSPVLRKERSKARKY